RAPRRRTTGIPSRDRFVKIGQGHARSVKTPPPRARHRAPQKEGTMHHFMRSVVAAAGLILAAVSTEAAAATCAAGPERRTDRGWVCGIVAGNTTQWLGIPYAAPPVGSLRWQPPQPHAPWSTTLAAVAKAA